MKKEVRSYVSLSKMRSARNKTLAFTIFFICGVYAVGVLAGITWTGAFPAPTEKIDELRKMISILFSLVVSFFPVMIFDYRSRWLEMKKKAFEEPLK